MGICLTLVIRYSTWSISIARAENEWYESDYLPIWAACAFFAVVAVWVRLPKLESAIDGLLVTGPPYGWLMLLLTDLLNSASEEPAALKNVRALVPLVVCLALSGAVLNPLISTVVELIRRRMRAPADQAA
jgi:hypothetical protein